MAKKVIRLKAKDLKDIFYPIFGGEEITTETEDKEVSTSIDFTEDELTTMCNLLDMFEGENDGEQEVLDTLMNKFKNIKKDDN